MAHQDGIHLPSSKTHIEADQRKVFQVMRGATEVLPVGASVREALESIRASRMRAWPVMEQENIVGILNRTHWKPPIGVARANKS